MKKQKGFTLIELLVVIAIIGILAAVILINLGATRNKAKVTAIKMQMDQMRTAAEDHLTSSATFAYTGFGTSANYTALSTGIGGNGGSATPGVCANTYCVSTSLPTTPVTYWCVDSTGYVGAPTAGTTCTGTSCACR